MSTQTAQIRNIAIAGHGGTGKTSFVEQILFCAGVIKKAELVESGKTVSDFTEEEIAHKISIRTSLSHVSWSDAKINILDTPGSPDFIGEVVAAFRATESAVLLVAARSGVQIETLKLWRRLNTREMPRMIFVNKLEEERADFQTALEDIREKFKVPAFPVTIPMGDSADFKGIIDLVTMKAYMIPDAGASETPTEIPEEYKTAADEARAALIEAAAEGDDELMEKFLEDENLSPAEMKRGLAQALRENKIVPVMCGSALQNSGVASFLEFVALAAPSPNGTNEITVNDAGEEEKVAINADAPFSGFAFKTTIDQFSGKLTYVKVVTGILNGETDFYNVREQKKDKIGKIYSATGKKLDEQPELVAGDIGILSKMTLAHTNDSFSTSDAPRRFRPLQLPQPVHSVAIEAVNKKDEDKLAQLLHRAMEEDPTFMIRFNPETKETVISSMGEVHLNMILDKVREAQKIEIETKIPKVAYRETITKPANAEYTHKKQTGGHGQYGRVVIDVKPIERGKHYEFTNAIKGGSVSRGFIPGIEKGFHEAMESGILAGYPVVDVSIALLDGKEHPVDSSEMAFKLAARGALRDAMGRAGATLLEPIVHLSVFIEEQYVGDILSDLSARRGRVLGQEPVGGGIVEIKAQVPQAELLRYSIDLKSITSGTGGFEMDFDHYSPISGKIAEDVIKASQEAAEAAHA
ncbi:MAG: elongation factor G [Spirochaetaceae bacterium]|nr:MAG: elongation factor G [Spirochaetaceae bacterium]